MSVEKMKLVNLIGPVGEFDRIVGEYVFDSNIHLEDIFSVVINAQGFLPFNEANPYDGILKKVNDTLSMVGIKPSSVPKGDHSMPASEIDAYADQVTAMLSTMINKREEFARQLEENNIIISQVERLMNINIPIEDLFNFEHVKIRFGKMPKEPYKKLNQFLSDYYAAFFFKFGEDKDSVYGAYCAPAAIREKIDTLFSSLYFERMRISDKVSGLPRDIIKKLGEENAGLEANIAELGKDMDIIIGKEREKLYTAARSIYHLHGAFGVRKYAAHTSESFYIAGWIPESEAEGYARRLDAEPTITLLFEEPDMAEHLKPPTKLKNNRLIRPFEKFVEMYSLPSYNELDPTLLFALTYSLMFGVMYGDIGHGAVLALVGVIMQRKKMFLGPILKICGFVAVIFGVFYGSIFGIELEYGFMYKPMGQGNIMKTLIAAVAFGTVIIGASMILNMVNGIKQKDMAKVLFDPNGLAGFVFYWAIIIGVLSVFTGNSIMKNWYIVLFVVLPLILIFLKEPLSRLIRRKADWVPKNKGEFIIESFFTMFELVLSYVTNTISFIRVGAFALIHAGMMMVVYSLANVAQHFTADLSAGQVMVLVGGNIVVLGLEGLLVAIQVLRLEFYEMFGRYFAGGGKPFLPSVVKMSSDNKAH